MIFLNLDRPIVFFDLETTGVSREYARIVQIALIKIMPNGEVIKKCRLINPGMVIPQDAIDIHEITNEMVENELKFKQIYKSLYSIFDGCDIGGFNSRVFDLPILRNEFKRCGIEYNYLEYNDIDVLLFERYLRKLKDGKAYIKNKSKLTELYTQYTGKTLDGAHDALIDVMGTIDVFNGQLIELTKIKGFFTQYVYDFISNNGSYTITNKKIIKKGEQYIWNFGKNNGNPIVNDYIYAKWFIGTNTFPLEERNLVKKELNIL